MLSTLTRLESIVVWSNLELSLSELATHLQVLHLPAGQAQQAHQAQQQGPGNGHGAGDAAGAAAAAIVEDVLGPLGVLQHVFGAGDVHIVAGHAPLMGPPPPPPPHGA
eukprot:354396-Chlamydomonas_euryale.AAC.1